jgi:hypothetical protein
MLLASLAGLIWFSHRLAGVRIYHADECQNVSMARIIATGQTKAFYAEAGLFQTGVLGWLARGATRSVDIFVPARFVMLEIFWLNVVLMALATGERLFSRRGLIALVGAATLAPLWDFGFEIRPDNLLLCGVLLMWCVVRVRPKGLQPFFIAGALAAGLQFVAFEAAAFTLPISAAILAFPPPGQRARRWMLVLAWAAGALGMFAIIRVAYGAAGLWDVYMAEVRRVLGDFSGGDRSGLGEALRRLLGQTPLLLAFLTAALVAVAVDLRRRGKAALTWDGSLPEALLFLGALVVLLLNPAPEPYNLLLLVPYGFLLAFRYGSGVIEEVWGPRAHLDTAAEIPESGLPLLHEMEERAGERRPQPFEAFPAPEPPAKDGPLTPTLSPSEGERGNRRQLSVGPRFIGKVKTSGAGLGRVGEQLSLRPVLVALLVFAHFVPFGVATRRHLRWTNYDQEARMGLAEELTDPARDQVYDGIGLVPTRPSTDFCWLLPEGNRRSLAEERGLQVRDMLAARPAAVVIPNYRTDRLPEEDQAFIREHYVSLNDDFWVLGKVLPAGGGTFEVVHPGRYRVSSLEGSDLAGTYPDGMAGLMAPVVEGSLIGTLDGVPLSKRPVELTVGTHRIETKPDCQAAVVWMGPRKERIGRMGGGDHRFLFRRWY